MALHPFRILALCAGAGGLELGLSLAVPGAQLVGAVERDAYAAAVLVARMADQSLGQAPVWDDVVTFNGRPWRGVVDCVAAGFPCQPFSFAGKRRGTADDRWLWPDIARVVGEIRPRYVFLNNTPGLVRYGLAVVIGDLADLGFDAEWGVFSAAEVGAPHPRKRLFLLADAERAQRRTGGAGGRGADGPDDHGGERSQGPGGVGGRGETVVNAARHGRGKGRAEPGVRGGRGAAGRASGDLPRFPPGPDDSAGWADWLDRAPGTQPAIRGDAARVAGRLDRLRVAGNGVVPLVAATAFRDLYGRLTEATG